MPSDNQSRHVSYAAVAAAGWLIAGWATASMTVLTVLESANVAANFISRTWWQGVIEFLGGTVRLQGATGLLGEVSFWPVATLVAGVMIAGWAGSALVAGWRRRSFANCWSAAGANTGMWACVAGSWSLTWLTASVFGTERLVPFLEAIVDLWCAVAVTGWWAGVFKLCERPTSEAAVSADVDSRRGFWWVVGGIAVYTTVYTAMNWQMYWGLLIPHGDSAMYEEHLWNVLHGKGFRSYLDQGLFLGEHIQVIHLALIPLYNFWPSHLLLELCESFALALTALPVYWIARRHTQSDRAAVWMALATLLYFPIHFLDIAIDLKTFRPISFGVPLLMLAIDQLERGRLWTMAALFVATLTAKEDFAIVVAPLGVWLFLSTWFKTDEPRARVAPVDGERSTGPIANTPASARARRWFGAATAVLATLYLFLAVKVFIPWFRGGETVHYARYFSKFGETPTEIVTNMLTQPGLFFGELLTAGTIVYALRVLVPLGGTPLLSPSRLLVGAPLFLLLCLNELAQETPAPVHHFHAPLVPIVLWAAAAGLPNLSRLARFIAHQAHGLQPVGFSQVLTAARFAGFCALFTSAIVSIDPLSIKFWDAGRTTYWRRLFVPGERARQFAKIESLIPLNARVASTDFVHPRYTHHQRSYDYSDYLRKVAGYEHRVPGDTDYIVIDTQHPYSNIKRPEDVRELREHPERWELLPDETEGYFIVLKRRE